MNRMFFAIAVFLAPCTNAVAQQVKTTGHKVPNQIRRELWNYTVNPCMASQRVNDLVQKAWKEQWRKDSLNHSERVFYTGNIKISDADFNTFTASEKFIYAHQYPESYIQTCGLYDISKDMSSIPANIPSLFDGERMSMRQLNALKENRDSVLLYLTRCIDFNSHTALGYKQTIIAINAWELIPSILSMESGMFEGRGAVIKDPYVYSLLTLLMKENSFVPFKNSSIFQELYGPDKGYRQKLKFTISARNEIINHAEKFYLSKSSETK